MKKKENQNNYIYVVLVKALTGLGKFARLTSKYDYTHIAVCLDEKLDKFYTFSRRKHYSPFDCGFMIETLDCYAFGKNKNVKLKVFKVPVSKENKEKIEKYIENISEDSKYIFNFYSMITMPNTSMIPHPAISPPICRRKRLRQSVARQLRHLKRWNAKVNPALISSRYRMADTY